MEYYEAADTLERLPQLRPKLGTGTTASLLDSLGDPHQDTTTVQIAGSNGKGSTARMLARILREAGLDVGLYTSPDLNDRRERIRVQGRKIPKRAVVQFVEQSWSDIVDRSVEGEAPTFFEAFTVMAFWYFARENVDVAVLEVGIGGRYDATSVVDPEAAAVTNISLEHTDIIGDTIEEIARDKAQVAPVHVPLVTGASGTALETIREETDVLTVGDDGTRSDAVDGSKGVSGRHPRAGVDVQAAETGMVSLTESSVSLSGPGWKVQTRTPLLGRHQAVNAGIAATLARQVADPTEDEIAAGIRNVRWPGRFEVMDDTPLVILDGAHNPDACAKLSALLDRFDYEELHLVFGAMRDKDHRAMCQSLPSADRVSLVEPSVDRAQETDTLAAAFDRETDAEVDQFGSVLGALDRAIRDADDPDCVLVTGSLYTVGEARDRWTRTPRPVRADTVTDARTIMKSADVPVSERRERATRMVHRTIRLHVRREEATELKERMLSLGGSGAVSGGTTVDRHAEVVLSGTRDQFEGLVRELRGRVGDGRRLATQLNEALGIAVDETSGNYPWENGTTVMGVLNVTPDSFHDGGEHDAVEDAVKRAREMVASGADVVDVGGESTRPGADPVSGEVELERVLPVLDRLGDLDTMLSIDTRKPTVAEAALDAGADMVNDVCGLTDAAMRHLIADRDVPAVLMHSVSTPVDSQRNRTYDDVVDDVLEELGERVLLAERSGIDRSRMIVDPGIGFGKRATESFELLDRLEEFRALGTAVMVGHSHKSMFERVGYGPDDRLAPTVAATALATERGADLVRVHDVASNVAAIATAEGTAGAPTDR